VPLGRDALAELSVKGLPHATELAYGVLLTQAVMTEALSYMADICECDVVWSNNLIDESCSFLDGRHAVHPPRCTHWEGGLQEPEDVMHNTAAQRLRFTACHGYVVDKSSTNGQDVVWLTDCTAGEKETA